MDENQQLTEKLIEFCKDKDSYQDFDFLFEMLSEKEKELLIDVMKRTAYPRLISQYLLNYEVDANDFIELTLIAIKRTLPEKDEHVQNLIRKKANQLKLSEKIINTIKSSGSIEMIVCAAVSYDTKLIDDIFGGKLNMYLYLSSAGVLEDETEYFIERLLKIDNNELSDNLNKINENINTKILNKKIID